MINELENLIEKMQDCMKEKKIIYNKFMKNYNDAKKDLLLIKHILYNEIC